MVDVLGGRKGSAWNRTAASLGGREEKTGDIGCFDGRV